MLVVRRLQFTEVLIQPEHKGCFWNAFCDRLETGCSVYQIVTAPHDGVDVDLFPALLQEVDDAVFHHVGQQRGKSVGAVIDHSSTIM
ncbi:hypothetical protein D3C81_1964580 [compost metagenome]